MTQFPKSPVLPALLAFALFQLPATLRAESPDTPPSLFNDPIVASGKGFEVKRSQVDDAFINYNASLVAKGSSIPETQRASVRSNLLNSIIVDKILVQMATDDDKAKAKKQVDDYLDRARTNAPTPEAFDQQIKSTGLTLAQLHDRLQDERLSSDVLWRNITNGVVVTDAEVKKYYDDNPERFKMPERVRAAHILLSTEDQITHQPIPPEKKKEKLKLANELKARAEKGEDFAALAKQYSDDPGSKNNGGEYTFPRGRMVHEFETAAFSMKVNQISDPVETQFGYHIIKLLEKIPAATVEFAKAEPDIRDGLIRQEVQKRLPAYFDKLKADANVKIVDQGQDKAAAAPAK